MRNVSEITTVHLIQQQKPVFRVNATNSAPKGSNVTRAVNVYASPGSKEKSVIDAGTVFLILDRMDAGRLLRRYRTIKLF